MNSYKVLIDGEDRLHILAESAREARIILNKHIKIEEVRCLNDE